MDKDYDQPLADEDTRADFPDVDLDAELKAVRRIESNADGFLMYGSEMVPMIIEQRGRDGIVASAVGTLALEDSEEIHFPADDARPGGIVVCEPIRVVHESGITNIWARYVSGFASSEAALLHLIAQRLWLAELSADAIVHEDDGWLYRFANATPTRPNLKDRVEQLNREQNRQSRANIRQNIGWSDDHDRNSGMAYRISEQAVTVMADERLPAEGSRVSVNFPLNCGQCVVSGVVAWVMPAGAGTHAGAFTMNIDEVNDGDEGRLWRTYIDELLVLSNRPF
ncbi:MAG: hypothetical protein ACI9WU_003578 [Myxococcota bacterium]|jgi:hypothetical protein